MASNVYIQHYADGTKEKRRRRIKQGRKSSGLAKPKLYRLYEEDFTELLRRRELMGRMFNENEFIRQAVRKAVEETRSIYTELVKL